jgi:hypothetical protein
MSRPAHGYTDAEGNKIPGVTTITGRFKDSGGLIGWANKVGREGMTTYQWEAKHRAKEFGTHFHDCVEAKLKGDRIPALPGVLQDVGGALGRMANCLDAFDRWNEQTNYDPILIEHSLVSEKLRFGGTMDLVSTVGGLITVTDWKTGNGIYGDTLVQIRAYGILLEECEGIVPDQYETCRVGKDDGAFHHSSHPANGAVMEAAKEQFMLWRRAYELDQIIRKGV